MTEQALKADEVDAISQTGQGKGAAEAVEAWRRKPAVLCAATQDLTKARVGQTSGVLGDPQQVL